MLRKECQPDIEANVAVGHNGNQMIKGPELTRGFPCHVKKFNIS